MTTSVAVVGPGRVGTTLALALRGHPSYEVRAVTGRRSSSLESFSRVVPEAEVQPLARLAADLVLVTVPDDQLGPVVQEAARVDAAGPGVRWVHTAGRDGIRVLRPLSLLGARVAACHPAQTFPEPGTAVRTLQGVAWAVTAAPEDRGWAEHLVADLGGRPVGVPEDRRVLYHAGLAVGANGTASVVALARDLLLASGITHPEEVLEPLVGAASRAAAAAGVGALTGPVRRGDAGTVAAHLDELTRSLPEALGAYRALARLAVGQARRAGLRAELADEVERQLGRADGVKVAVTAAEARALVRELRGEGLVGLVPTMGALHDGHRALLRRAHRECDVLVASVFVNPLQFDADEDFAVYPRDLQRDRAILAEQGVDVLFAPEAATFTAAGRRTRVVVDGLTDVLEGAHRPGHFDGVATVVTKLLHVLDPDRAYFGEKDYQQLVVVRRMVVDLDLAVAIVSCETVRDADGLALSSRNVRLTADARERALALPRALRAARQGWDGDTDRARARLREVLGAQPGIEVEYADVVDPQTLRAPSGHTSAGMRAVVAARVGPVRLIDNRALPALGD